MKRGPHGEFGFGSGNYYGDAWDYSYLLAMTGSEFREPRPVELSQTGVKLQKKFQELQQEVAMFAKKKGRNNWMLHKRKRISPEERSQFMGKLLQLVDDLRAFYAQASSEERQLILDWLSYIQSTMRSQLGVRRENYVRGLGQSKR